MFRKGNRIEVIEVDKPCKEEGYKIGDTGTIYCDSNNENVGTIVVFDNGITIYLYKSEMRKLQKRNWLWQFFNEGV